MDIREATEHDSDRIRAIAEQSFRSSYSFSPLEIETIVEDQFGDEAIVNRLDDDEQLFLVAEEDDFVSGFATARIEDADRGEIIWLHVDLTERGQEVGTELTERVLEALRDRSVGEIRALVLGQNQEGGEFFERFGLEHSGEIDLQFGDETFRAEVHTDAETEDEQDEYTVPESGEITVEGATRFIAPKEPIAGDEGQFLLVFETADREDRFGFYCTNCGSFTNSVDDQGKVLCEDCGNEHKPEDWDGSYL